MKIYLVGGAIRDEMLGLPVKERDWVVVGGTPEELIAKGFQPVGKAFPVFIHPETHEEYALARTERKIGKGYKGFTFYTAPDVSLEEDLKRRDLTINAMARSPKGGLIDPYHGQHDLQNKLLRHISSAFAEDPVRILRLARFASKLTEFQVAEETNKLMKKMVTNGEVNALVKERVWQELARALSEKAPQRFFIVLDNCGALKILFPEINPQGNGIKALAIATILTADPVIRFATLFHDIAESSTKNFCHRLRVPREFANLAHLISQWFQTFQQIKHATANTILHFIKSTDALRRLERFEKFLLACHACLLVYDPKSDFSRQSFLIEILKNMNAIDLTALQAQNLKGHEFGKALHDLQLAAIKKAMKKSQHN